MLATEMNQDNAPSGLNTMTINRFDLDRISRELSDRESNCVSALNSDCLVWLDYLSGDQLSDLVSQPTILLSRNLKDLSIAVITTTLDNLFLSAKGSQSYVMIISLLVDRLHSLDWLDKALSIQYRYSFLSVCERQADTVDQLVLSL
jgi:hypothetical protein